MRRQETIPSLDAIIWLGLPRSLILGALIVHGGPVYGTQAPVIENFLRVIATCGDNNRKSFSVREAGVVLSRLHLLSYINKE